jgi:mRNA interferase ChpB
MKRGDIYMASLDPTKGHEQRGNRPVLIVSPDKFNAVTQLPIICPITCGGDFACRIGFSIQIIGIKTTGIIRCDQPRVVDLGARNAYKIDTLPEEIMEEVLAKIATVFE